MLYEKNNLLVFVFILFVVGAGFSIPAFAEHVTAEVSISAGTSIPGCEGTNSCFFPSKVSVDVGGKVVWSNDDTKTHAVASGTYEDGPDGFFENHDIMSGDTFSVKFDGFEPGDYTYFDLIYPWMIGTVTVEGDKLMPSIETETSNIEISDAIPNLSKHFIQSGELAILWLGNHNIGSLEGHH